MDHPFKLGQEHLPYPNGGGLKKMTKVPESQGLELKAMQAKHELELAKLKEKHTKANQIKVKVPKKPMRKTQGR